MNLSLYLSFLPLFNTLPRPPSSPLSRNYRISGNSGPTLSYPFSKPSNLPLSSALNSTTSPPPHSLSLSLSMLSILKEAGQADNLAVLLLVGRSLAFYMLKATVRQPFSPLYTSSPPPSTHARSPRSLVFHPTAALFRAAPTHNGYGSTVENRRVFLFEHQFRFLPSLLSSGIYTLIISTFASPVVTVFNEPRFTSSTESTTITRVP